MTPSFSVIIIFIFILLLVVSFFIEDKTLRLCYWLVVMLLALTTFNILLSYTYYTRLRNEPGKMGKRGPQGPPGSRGPKGVCSISEKCGIEDCDSKIAKMAHNIFPDIRLSCLKDGNCRHSERAVGIPVHNILKDLKEECLTTKMAEPDFMKHIRPKLIRLQKDGDIH